VIGFIITTKKKANITSTTKLNLPTPTQRLLLIPKRHPKNRQAPRAKLKEKVKTFINQKKKASLSP